MKKMINADEMIILRDPLVPISNFQYDKYSLRFFFFLNSNLKQISNSFDKANRVW